MKISIKSVAKDGERGIKYLSVKWESKNVKLDEIKMKVEGRKIIMDVSGKEDVKEAVEIVAKEFVKELIKLNEEGLEELVLKFKVEEGRDVDHMFWNLCVFSLFSNIKETPGLMISCINQIRFKMFVDGIGMTGFIDAFNKFEDILLVQWDGDVALHGEEWMRFRGFFKTFTDEKTSLHVVTLVMREGCQYQVDSKGKRGVEMESALELVVPYKDKVKKKGVWFKW